MNDTLIVYVAALTFQREESLRHLLDVFRGLELPAANVDVRFLIIDNDPGGSAQQVVEAQIPCFNNSRLCYLIEPEPGIPAGRNRALAEAINGGGQLLCFTDDDVRPDGSWLKELVACYQETHAALVFGPTRFTVSSPVDGWWRRFLAESIVARAAFVERYAAREANERRVSIGATNNCLIDLIWMRNHGIRFCSEMKESGGSDTVFRETVRKQGGALAWCCSAVVYEQLPQQRITLRYQFKRARSHGMTAERIGRRPHVLILRHPAGRILAGIGLMILPALGKASFVVGLHLVGMGVGILQARQGRKSTLYRRQ